MHFSVQSAVLLVLLFEKKLMCFSRPTKDLVYTLHLTIRGSILSTYIFQNHDVIFDDESHFKINKKRKEFEFESTNIILFLISTQELLTWDCSKPNQNMKLT